MKRVFTFLIASIFVFNIYAQNDTTEVKVMKKNIVTVVENNRGTSVKVGNGRGVEVITDDWGDTTKIRIGRRTFKVIDGSNGTYLKVDKREKSKRWTGHFNAHWSGLEVGINRFYEPDYSIYKGTEYEQLGDVFELRPNKSLSWNLNFAEYAFTNKRKTFGVVTGMGISFNDYAFDSPVTIAKQNGNGMIVPVNIEASESPVKKTKLHVNYFTVPLMLEIKTPLRMGRRNLYIAGGVIGGIYLGAHTKYKYNNGDKEKSRGNYHINQWKYDITARLGFGSFCVFANYSKTPLFKTNMGPDIHPLMIGFSITDF
jgi:hypothetical protein